MQRTVFDRVNVGGTSSNNWFPLQVTNTGTVTCLIAAPPTAVSIGRRIFVGASDGAIGIVECRQHQGGMILDRDLLFYIFKIYWANHVINSINDLY